ncbi:hypothetical protein EDC01DRAFT_779994 [Geopyxis carbonaria]|nr:hypothetical protein EDC01DRAFT_779994 [Geopyxis carbonaria]
MPAPSPTATAAWTHFALQHGGAVEHRVAPPLAPSNKEQRWVFYDLARRTEQANLETELVAVPARNQLDIQHRHPLGALDPKTVESRSANHSSIDKTLPGSGPPYYHANNAHTRTALPAPRCTVVLVDFAHTAEGRRAARHQRRVAARAAAETGCGGGWRPAEVFRG